jgi:hypothetical protein
VLVAYNLWLAGTDLDRARRIAAAVRGDGIRALGLDVGGRLQVSLNLVEPLRVGPGAAHDRVSAAAGAEGDEVTGAELVGLVPAAVLHREPAGRWRELDLGEDRTIEARLEARRLGRRPWDGVLDRRPPARRRRQAEAGPARRASARWRRRRRRSRSLIPPQIPNFSPLSSAYSRQSSRTTQPRQTSLASRVDAPRSGKNRSGSTPRQLA